MKEKNIFCEKADDKILNNCKSFISQNQSVLSDYYTYRCALDFYGELSQSLIDSQKDLNDAINKLVDKIIAVSYPKTCIEVLGKSTFLLIPDQEAHNVLYQLEKIVKSNQKYTDQSYISFLRRKKYNKNNNSDFKKCLRTAERKYL